MMSEEDVPPEGGSEDEKLASEVEKFTVTSSNPLDLRCF